MNDREMLKLAAKAAAYKLDQDQSGTPMRVDRLPVRPWNPLVNNADAFALLVKLGLVYSEDRSDKGIRVIWFNNGATRSVLERYGPEKAAVARRAIVRAAATIQRDKEGQ